MLQTAVDVGAEVLGQLHRCSSDGSRRAVDEDAPTLERACLSKAREGDDRSVADGRSFFE